jgi:hypothetical protein
MDPDNESGKPLFHGLASTAGGFSKKVIVTATVFVVVAGLTSGFILSKNGGKGMATTPSTKTTGGAPGVTTSDHKVGIQDSKTFRDCAKGQLEKGGIGGEGTHHLLREGGPSQTAYLTSSVVDLDQFVGKTIQVCGETIASKRAGWLMDIGLVSVLE